MKTKKKKPLRPKDRPLGMLTIYRLVPMLPEWMAAKLTEATELFNHCNTCMEDCLIWNHTITLPLDENHDITFSILDNTEMPEKLKKEVGLIVEVYQSLQTIYREYGHSLTIVSLQTDDFGMYLPYSFYEPLPEKTTKTEQSTPYKQPEVKDFIKRLMIPRLSRMEYIHFRMEVLLSTLDEKEKLELRSAYQTQYNKLMECIHSLEAVLGPTENDYYSELMWDFIDIYMSDSRGWTREFCVKWGLDDDVEQLKKLDELRPVIDDIVKKTRHASFAFGVKPRGKTVVPGNCVNAV